MNAPAEHKGALIWALLHEVPDPEIPVLSICDLGIVREVRSEPRVEVVLTPTYAGCPAMHAIEESVLAALHSHGYADAQVRTTLAPPWTTDWITPAGRARLKEYGIAPPGAARAGSDGNAAGAGAAQPIRFATLGRREQPVACPLCDSTRTELLSQFGSTACKALYRCLDCREPFDYFKPY